MVAIEVTSEYSAVLLVACIIAFQCLIEGFGAGGARKTVFTKKFFETNFPELKGKYNPQGYPDMGSGKYSQKLSFDHWLLFNNAQRVHYNFIEHLTLIITVLLVSGIFFPKYALWAGIAYSIGRVLYGLGYKNGGASARVPGALILDVSLVSLFGMAVYGTFQAAGGVAGLKVLVLP
eukprot:TRINITY_DN385_c0_g1_i2.p1 TRINITY_DN385_c0_g1~~TRINITY_DN385_c0_g1_i2.p1  ORF type:complete len:177 (+),score=45.29 TRINITY_DN385_c0_g1_i2:479-1009(+)